MRCRLCAFRQILDAQDQLCEVLERHAPPGIPPKGHRKVVSNVLFVEECNPFSVRGRYSGEFL